MFHEIKSSKDIEEFLEKTNGLHDGEILELRYSHRGITRTEDGHRIDPTQTKLTLQILVTSIWDAIVEIEFEHLTEWQIRDNSYSFDEIYETSVRIEKGVLKLMPERNWIVWSDETFINLDELKECSYVISEFMRWRFVEQDSSIQSATKS